MTFLFSIALAVFQQFELIWANYLNMEPQMENVAGKLFHSQPFSLTALASRCATCFPRILRQRGFRPQGRSAPSGHTGSKKKTVTFQPEDCTSCRLMCTFPLQPVLCQHSDKGHCATTRPWLPNPPGNSCSFSLTMEEQQSLQSWDVTGFPS